ncbi:hypothetical protein POTG_02227 [Paenibacillus sp. oral taxon 786 str. D14]|uniref:hypothetical protein n=1 Tax=Paenibacillus sp. oral taxon 786 TaxID=652715 RepID=UPI0001AFD9D4|nr:hypothetical protein [Paenibacillus sp. oral taxon 786]EES73127.1 hypothetical protein POTG_02227 [Paenibacillus sp. oral taxon 786 str. D14]
MIEDILFRQGIYYLSKAASPSDVMVAWSKMGHTAIGKKLIVSLDHYHKSLYTPELVRLIDDEDSHCIPYFESEKLFCLDEELLSDMLQSEDGKTHFGVDYSIAFDTNYASYIHKFVNNEWTGLSNEVFSVIDILIRHNFQYDYLFYMFENYKNTFDPNVSFDEKAIKERKEKLFLNLVSLEMFKNIDNEEYSKHKKIRYRISKTEAYLMADQIYNGIFHSSQAKEFLNYFQTTQRHMVLLIIGIMQIKFESKLPPVKKTEKLFRYVNDIVGVYFEREMVIAYKYFVNNSTVKMLNRLNRGMRPDKLLQLIENIAWDFSAPRILEHNLLTISRGRYFIPFFLSNDAQLREMLRLYQVKGIIFQEENLFYVPFTRENVGDYFQNQGCDIDKFFLPEANVKRRSVHEYVSENIESVIREEFQKLLKILDY